MADQTLGQKWAIAIQKKEESDRQAAEAEKKAQYEREALGFIEKIRHAILNNTTETELLAVPILGISDVVCGDVKRLVELNLTRNIKLGDEIIPEDFTGRAKIVIDFCGANDLVAYMWSREKTGFDLYVRPRGIAPTSQTFIISASE